MSKKKQQQPNAALRVVPDDVPNEPVERDVPASLLAELRRLDQGLASMRQRLDALTEGFLAGLGTDPTQQLVTINLDTGCFRIEQRPEPETEPELALEVLEVLEDGPPLPDEAGA